MSKRNLFEKRVEAKPYEYPELIDFKDAIRHSYWLSSEFNYTSDIQDYHVNVTPAEKSVFNKSYACDSTGRGIGKTILE